MSVIALLRSIFSVLLSGRGMFLTLRVITLGFMLSGSAMRHRCSPIGLKTAEEQTNATNGSLALNTGHKDPTDR
jgi:hypothetical protein